MSSRIPTSTSVTESAVINAPLSSVWHLIKLHDFNKWWTKVAKATHVKGTSHETDVVKWHFKDSTVLDIKMEEHSVRIQKHFVDHMATIFPYIEINVTIIPLDH
jgi:hypothetical protein